eukprot:CAMPEP_0175234620 /NCGR_PEP_ID=MMETSP0093-20121207/27077_1 /TAXON_ID=311494 /ORGANISM="Alexandrium monilatum, Strain CCMP3105" /LENGTH=81 /DNA_ID=CAMNT_0016528531 /DNA_START=31 /DNA_END=272 /DNA_ORIENTATION=-
MRGVSPAGLPSASRAMPLKTAAIDDPSPMQWCMRSTRAESSPACWIGMRCTRQSGYEWSKSTAISSSIRRRTPATSASAGS